MKSSYLFFIILPAELKGCEVLIKTWQLDEACVKMETPERSTKANIGYVGI